jgi:iron complex outermembrane receptor protein
LIQPAAANDNFVIAVSAARAARNPALEELYFYGPHPGNLAFEIGNPDLQSENGVGFDLSIRGRSSRFEGEVTVFYNNISNYVFRNPLTEEEFHEREDEFNDRFNVDEDDEDGEHDHGEFPFVEFVGRDSTLAGFEAHGDVKLTSTLTAEATFDMVRGELSDTGEPLPRIPPARLTAGLTYLLNTVTARIENVGNTLYRNHLNYLKDVLPEIGRSLRLVYAVSF